MTLSNILLAGLLGLSASPAAAFGSGDKGTTGAELLKIGPGARPAGMGGAFAAVADDVHSVYYNPAGLGALNNVEVSGMHDSYFQGINYEFGALAVPLLRWRDTKLARNRYGVAAFAVYSLQIPGLERRGVVETDAPDGTFDLSDFAYALSYAYAVPDTGLSLGVTAKFIDLNLDDAHARGFAADVGALYRFERLSAAAGLRNGGTVQKMRLLNDPLPMTFFTGIGYRFSAKLLAAVEVDAPRDRNGVVALGGEYRHPFSSKLSGSLRAGYNSRQRGGGGLGGASLGAGLRLYNFNVDFAWVPYGDLGDTFRYSLHVKF